MEPDRVAVAVHDQGRVLAGGLLSGGLLGGDEHVSRCRPRNVGVDLDGRRAEIGPRAKSPRQARPPWRGGRPGARAPLATKEAAQRDPGRSGREDTEEPPTRDPHSRPFVTRPPTQTRPFVRRQRCHTRGTTLRLPRQVDSRATGPLTSDGHKSLPGAHTPTADRPTPVIFPEKAQIARYRARRSRLVSTLSSLVGTLGLAPVVSRFAFCCGLLRRKQNRCPRRLVSTFKAPPQDDFARPRLRGRRRRPPGAGSNASA